MLDMAAPIYRMYPQSRWLTVGDGRFGSDAAYLLQRGISAIATSLTDEQLRQAHARGFIAEYRAENAEKLSLPEKAVDFVLCKESYHHFPRPPMALYEMLRVARQAAVLIEPVDNPGILNWVRNLAKKVLRGDTQHEFEPSGNYLYRTSMRELRKLLLAMGGEAFAYKGFNDFYLPRLSLYRADTLNVGSIVTQLGVFVQNLLSRLGVMGCGLACIVVFAGSPSEEVLSSLRQEGFTIQRLPKNPYSSS